MTKKNIIQKLNDSIQKKEPLIGVSIGNGRSARQAQRGGADLLIALNAGRFRMSGAPSMLSMLPYANSNDMVYDFATKEILPKIHKIPVLFGACAQDPTISHSDLIDKLVTSGFQGINNFPTVSLVDGVYREYLEENNEGFSCEVELLRLASEKGMFTVAFAVTRDEAILMAKANVDILCIHFGWTYIHRPEEKNIKPYVDTLINKTNEILNVVNEINPNIIPMIYGGSIVINTDVMKRFYEETEVVGYFGGSVFDVIPVEDNIKNALENFKSMNRVNQLENENEILKSLLIEKQGARPLLGNSEHMVKLRTLVKKVSNHDANILIMGESGTGKDLVVKTIHYSSDRAIYPFKKVNCASIPINQIESELFGHEKGAFLGADKQRIGRFESANNGTLFLDNIIELDLNVQAKLLRVIQDKEFERVGGSETIEVDIRIISTTNSDLVKAVKENKFREDLFYLLNVLTIDLPPLKEHKEDIPLLTTNFLKTINDRHHSDAKVSAKVMDAFMSYDWPGNIRELKNALERGVILCDGSQIDVSCLPSSISILISKDSTVNYIKNSSMIIEKELIIEELKKLNWNQTHVAKKLGVTRRTLYNKIKKYGIILKK